MKMINHKMLHFRNLKSNNQTPSSEDIISSHVLWMAQVDSCETEIGTSVRSPGSPGCQVAKKKTGPCSLFAL